jgi:SSS family solute:Na+ symporter
MTIFSCPLLTFLAIVVALFSILLSIIWAVIASANLLPFVFGLYQKTPSKSAALISMVGGSLIALVWMMLRNPYGIHGFIPGVASSLILFVVISLFTKNIDRNKMSDIVNNR